MIKIIFVAFITLAVSFGQGCNAPLHNYQDRLNSQSDQVNLNPDLQISLEDYFRLEQKKNVTVKYEYLRKAGTETGMSFPKYYVWVEISDGLSFLQKGAARLSGTDTNKFEVTHYLSESEIKANPANVYSIFPKQLSDEIIKRADSKG